MNADKIDPHLLMTLDEATTVQPKELAARRSAVGVRGGTSPGKPLSAIVFLHCDEHADFSGHDPQAVQINQSSGEIRTGLVRLDKLEELSNEAWIRRIVAARSRRPLMDVAPGRVRVPAFKSHVGATGKGVIVGVVDSGIDTHHPAFGARVLRIWDQERSGNGVPDGRYGKELVGNERQLSKDTEGHGTHVAGIAAGADAKFGGIAPDADIVAVKTNFTDVGIADGIRYVFRVAKELGRPAVVNLSLGGHSDAHDGSDELSQTIDALTGPGRIVCCAAGNEGEDDIHAQITVAPGATATIEFQVNAEARGVLLNGWCSGAGSLEVGVVAAGDLATPLVAVNGVNARKELPLPGHRVGVMSFAKRRESGDFHFDVSLTPSGAFFLAAGEWRLQVRNVSSTPARLDLWVADTEPAAAFTGASVNRSTLVGSPGAARGALTIGAFTTKVKWTTVTGDTIQSRNTGDTVCGFSSPGPLRGGARKPDLVAPGSMIVSAASRFASPDGKFVIDELHVAMQGTSMATPFVTGLVACLLQRDKNLEPEGLKAMLGRACRIPDKAAGSFDPKWGFGLIDAQNIE